MQRRYREFDALRERLLPIAHEASLSMPRLPSKFEPAWSRWRLGARRTMPLQRWLGWVAARPELWCDDLCEFLGLGQLEELSRKVARTSDASSERTVPASLNTASPGSPRSDRDAEHPDALRM